MSSGEIAQQEVSLLIVVGSRSGAKDCSMSPGNDLDQNHL